MKLEKATAIKLSQIKRYTNTELMSQIVKLVKEAGEYEKAENILDYFLPETIDVVHLTSYEFDFQAVAMFGRSEGIYLDCWLVGEYKCRMGTFKTLDTSLESMKIMAELGGILTFFLTEFVNQNLENFTSDKELN